MFLIETYAGEVVPFFPFGEEFNQKKKSSHLMLECWYLEENDHDSSKFEKNKEKKKFITSATFGR